MAQIKGGTSTGDTHYYVSNTNMEEVPKYDNNGNLVTGPDNTVTKTTVTRTWVTESDAYYHNDERVTIDIPSGITLTTQGGSTSDVTLRETETGDLALIDDTLTIQGYATTTGKKTITIRDATPSADRGGAAAAKPLPYTIYVTRIRGHSQSSYAIPSTASINLNRGGVTNGVGVGYFGRSPVLIYNGDNNHYPVTYTVTGTGATIYAQETPDRTTDKSGTSFSTSSAAKVYLSIASATATVTAEVDGAVTTTAVYIFGYPTLTITLPDSTSGSAGDAIMGITATVTDGRSTPVEVSDVPVKFEIVNPSTGALLTKAAGSGRVVDSSNNALENLPTAGTTLYIRTKPDETASMRKAVVDYEIGTAGGEQIIRVSAVGQTKDVKITNTLTSARQLSVRSKKRQDEFDIIATVTENEMRIAGVTVTFTTVDGGELTGTPHKIGTDTSEVVTDTTNARGEATAIYDPGTSTGELQILVSIPASSEQDAKTIRKSFYVRGAPPDDDDDDDDPPTIARTLDIGVSGEGNTRTVTVRALQNGVPQSGISVALSVSGAATLSEDEGPTPLRSTLTLPGTAGTFTLRASTTATGYSRVDEDVTVRLPGTLVITLEGAQVNGAQTIVVTARNAAGSLETTEVQVTLSGAGISRTVDVTGSQRVPIVLPTTSATLFARAEGYRAGSVILPARATEQEQEEQEQEQEAGVADSIEIDGNRQRSATVNQATHLRARVLDANNRGVRDVRVTFRVLRPGKGRLSQRGDGRAVQVQTDRNGYASASLTPLGGNLIVEAKAAGVTAPVTFIININVDEAPEDTETDTQTPDTTPRTTTTISPVVHINAANRPPMLWVDGGKIYALVGANVQEFGSGVEGAMNIAIGAGKVYWTEKTGESSGTINSANPDGTGVTELKSIMAVPMGIAMDTDAEKLFWTNSRGRIQSANLDGSGIQNVLQNLPNPMDIAVARGNLYWTQYDATESAGAVGIANLTGRGTPKYISTGADTPGGLVIGGNKVYWTEQTGTSSGTINSANINGNGATELNDIQAVPMGIAVDNARSKLFWTNSRGRIQSADLNGKKIQNVADGLGSPGDMIISNSIQAPTTTSTTTTPTTASNKYDINGDGTVDSTDAGLIVLAISTGDANDRLDVNGDGKVNFSDYVLVTENFTEDAAAAPTLLGIKMTSVEIDRLQEQIDLLIASGDRSPATMRALIYFQQLIAMARPEQTQLLANYPNPFNPETWIPYELATDTNVRITIYNPSGVVVQTIMLGHQAAGYYTGRDRAAYWDGRNAMGEQVASGIYFYQLETDNMSTMRKMVILK